MMATWSAENRLAQIRLAREWPALGQRSFACAQGELQLFCEHFDKPALAQQPELDQDVAEPLA